MSNKYFNIVLSICGLLTVPFLGAPGLAQVPQAPNPTQHAIAGPQGQPMPVYRVTVVSRTITAINYHHRSGSTLVDLHGTALMPEARGKVKAESKQGVIKIDANMERMRPATAYGPEYLTYVMWAITPEGRATNLGEVLLGGDKSKLNTTSELQAFGLIITAEPYFAVTQPSDVVVMENIVRTDTTGSLEPIEAKYELLKRGQYVMNVNPAELRPMVLDSKTPLELYEARNAVQIARWTGADRYAADTFQKALINLQNAEGYLHGKAGKKPIGTVAREAVQMAEDARIITVQRIEEERLANERRASAEREADARNREAEARAREAAAKEESARNQAERDRASRLRAQAEADRAAAETAKAQALAQQQAALAEAERARQATEEAKRATEQAQRERQQAETDKEKLRSQLQQQLNVILETRDTARGLIVNMSDVLFDTAKWTLKPGAREKLAKVSGILLSYPGLRIEVEGHTDSVGGDEYNQRLSEQRAASVREYLVQQGVPSGSITSRGFGKTTPVASNDTAAGRQMNRRVELVVSGEIIGTEVGRPRR